MEYNQTCANKFKKLKVYLSGYGPFMNIKENPSQNLVQSIISHKDSIHSELEFQCEIVHDTIYEVSVDYVKEKVTDCHSIIEGELNCGNCESLFLIIHFGVNSQAMGINLESQAVNSIRDHLKYNGKINEDGETNHHCKLNLEEICDHLTLNRHNVCTSKDAGTYLCNFIYYKSLEKFSKCDNVMSLFIHIPQPDICTMEDCEKCFIDFLKCVRNKYIVIN